MLVGGCLRAMNRDAAKFLSVKRILYKTVEPFCHEYKKEGWKGVSLADASRGGEGARGYAIDKSGEEGGRNEIHDPYDPGGTETKGCEYLLDIIPA